MDNEKTAQLPKEGNEGEIGVENETKQLQNEADDVVSDRKLITSMIEADDTTDHHSSESTPLDNEKVLTAAASDLVHSVLEAEGATSNSTSGISTPKDIPSGDATKEKLSAEIETKEETSISEEDEEKQPEFVISAEDPYLKATKFLEKHQLLTLFQALTADIVLKRPAQPLDFMIDEIETIQEQDRQRKGVFLNVNKQASSASEQTKTSDFGKEDIVDVFDK